MTLDRVFRPLRYFVIGLAGGLLGVVLARTIFGDAAPSLWLIGAFAVFALIVGILRDRAIRRGRLAMRRGVRTD